MDLVLSLPKTYHVYDSVLTVVNQFSKLVTFVPCMTSSTAADIAQLFFTMWCTSLECQKKLSAIAKLVLFVSFGLT